MDNEIDDSNSNFITNIVNKSGDTYYLRDINTYTKAETDNRIDIARNELQNRILLLEQSNTNGITKAEANATFLKKTEISGKVDKSTTINGIPLSSSYITLNGDNIYANFENNQLSLNDIFKVTGKVKSINNITPDNKGSISLTKSNIGLGNVDNTSDANKPVSTAVQIELNKKVNVIEGKSLSTNDLTNDLKTMYDSAVRDQHTHGNKAILDATTEAFTGHQDISGKADKNTVYTKEESDNLLNNKADKVDVYTKEESDNLLNNKADIEDSYTKDEVNRKVNEKADITSVYTKTETDTLLNAKSDSSNVYTKTEIDAIKTELLNNITTKIAEVVANAPEDFNTLKEISDWITEHANSAAEMNTAIQSKYEKPENGIPLSDLNEDVQASLKKADTALQAHQNISNKATKADTSNNNYGTDDFYYHTNNNESYLKINNKKYIG